MAAQPSLRADIAALRTRLVLETPVETPDGAGGVTRSWIPAATVWGHVTPTRGEDSVVAGAPGQTISHRVALRWRAGLDSSMRLKLGSRRFAIRSVYDPQERRRMLVCLCQEVKP
jgi:SPP1 family predicted phage head-tail adaptor